MEQLESLVGCLLDGRYLLRSVIGGGGSAVVFAGSDLLLSRPVAVKMLRSEAAPAEKPGTETREQFLARSSEARRMNRLAFVRESRAASVLSHPHIVTIFDVCAETDNPYIVMELVEGKPLSERLTALGILPLDEQLYIAACILEALAEAHANGIACNVFWSDDAEETKEFLDMGIDTILTNDYNRIAQIVSGKDKYYLH